MLAYRYNQDVFKIQETANDNDVATDFILALMKHLLLQSVEWTV